MSLGDKFRAGKARRQAKQLAKAQAKSDAGRNLTKRQQAMLDNAARWENPTQPTQPTSRTSYTPTFQTYNKMDQLDKEAGVSDTRLSNAPVEADTEDVTLSPKPKGRWVKQPDGTSKMVFDTGGATSKPSAKTGVKGVKGGYTEEMTLQEVQDFNKNAKPNSLGVTMQYVKGPGGKYIKKFKGKEGSRVKIKAAWAEKFGKDAKFPGFSAAAEKLYDIT